jgi:uncharacterized protein (TIGR02284 family)
MPDMNHQYTIETLQELIAVRRDGEQGFRTCAEHARSEPLKRIFMIHARECTQALRELQGLIRQLGGDPDVRGTVLRGTVSGAAHRGWANLRAALARNEDGAILDECEHGESRALEIYRNALDDPLPDFVRGVVLRQFEGVMSNHDQIRDIRNQRPISADVVTSTGAQAGQQ